MSMLWALTKTSGQKQPFIVDTPLARLDSKHRDNLVELFFPHASHQMMIIHQNPDNLVMRVCLHLLLRERVGVQSHLSHSPRH